MSTLVERENDRDLVLKGLQALGISEEHVREHGIINAAEFALAQMDQLENYEVEHYALPGFLVRQAILRAPSIITTERHKHWHPFVISYGNVSVFNELDGTVKHIQAIDAPGGHFTSITEPGTRRLIFVREDTLWTTFHRCDHADPNEMVRENITPNDNPLLQ
jgi:hypothetical protein